MTVGDSNSGFSPRAFGIKCSNRPLRTMYEHVMRRLFRNGFIRLAALKPLRTLSQFEVKSADFATWMLTKFKFGGFSDCMPQLELRRLTINDEKAFIKAKDATGYILNADRL